jgi:hypothetical protein
VNNSLLFVPPERRLRLVHLSPQQVLNCLCWRRREALPLLDVTGLPDGMRVVSLHADAERHCFIVLVYHPSFDEVPEGECPPLLTPLMVAVRLVPDPADPFTLLVPPEQKPCN